MRQLAQAVADALGQFADILAVCLVGSVARGNAGNESDVDLVVIGESRHRSSELVRRLPDRLRDPRLSLLSFSRDQWLAEAAAGSLFINHIEAEGVPLFTRDGTLAAGLEQAREQPPNVSAELSRQVGRLRLYREPSRLNGEHLFALSHLYAIGKAVAIARCIEIGTPIFVKEDALRRLKAHRPDLAEAVRTVDELRPFYDVTRDRQVTVLPFEPKHAEDRIASARAAITELAYG